MEDTALSGAWWRFSKYELRDGFVRPAERSRLEEYQPLDDFQPGRAGRSEHAAPYTRLIRLVEKLRFDIAGRLSPESEGDLLSWCSENGLLGLLLHQVQDARFAPRWEPELGTPWSTARGVVGSPAQTAGRGTKPRNKPAGRRKSPMLFLTQRFYTRSTCGTYRWGNEQLLVPGGRDRSARAGQVATRRNWSRAEPGVILRKLSTEEWARESLETTWAGFFPDVPPRQRPTYQYPEPYSEEFWRLYAEPLVDLFSAARLLREGFLTAAALKGYDTGADFIEQPGTVRLNALIAPAGPALVPTHGGLEQRVVSPSLLGTLAVMAQLDLASDRRVVRCHNGKCRNLVVAFGYQTRYCSQQCRFAAVKRTQRARLKKRPGKSGR